MSEKNNQLNQLLPAKQPARFARNLVRRIRQLFFPSLVAIFDAEYYKLCHARSFLARSFPFIHFLMIGSRKGFSPNYFFDPQWYAKHCELSQKSIRALLRHYLHTQEKYAPHPFFDPQWYLRVNDDIGEGVAALTHFTFYGRYENRSPSPLFDPEYYLQQLQEQLQEKPFEEDQQGSCTLKKWQRENGAAIHYLEYGYKTFNPCRLFDTAFIKQNYPQLFISNGPVILRYIANKQYWSLKCHPWFDGRYYLYQLIEAEHKSLPDEELKKTLAKPPLLHYLSNNKKTGYNPHVLFDEKFYLSRHAYLPELKTIQGAPLYHFVQQGAQQGESPHPQIDVAWYQQRYLTKASKLDPATHFLLIGDAQGNNPSQDFDTKNYKQLHHLHPGQNALMHKLSAFNQGAKRKTRRRKPQLEL